MELKISKAALKFMRENNIDQLSFVEHRSEAACCTGVAPEILAAHQAPSRPERYHKFEVEGVSIYVDRDLKLADKLTVKLRGILNKRLDLMGALCKII